MFLALTKRRSVSEEEKENGDERRISSADVESRNDR
jgi:hypothetical protein